MSKFVDKVWILQQTDKDLTEAEEILKSIPNPSLGDLQSNMPHWCVSKRAQIISILSIPTDSNPFYLLEISDSKHFCIASITESVVNQMNLSKALTSYSGACIIILKFRYQFRKTKLNKYSAMICIDSMKIVGSEGISVVGKPYSVCDVDQIANKLNFIQEYIEENGSKNLSMENQQSNGTPPKNIPHAAWGDFTLMNMDCKSNFDTKESDVYPVEVVDNDTNTRVNEEEHKISENTTAGEIPADKGTIVDDLDELYLLNESSQIQFMEESEEDEQNATSSSPMHSQKERSERLDDYLMEPDDTDFDTVNTITQIEGAVEDLSPISFHNRSDNGNSSGVIKENTEPPQPVEPLPDENSQKSNSEAEREKSNAVSDHQPADTTFLNPQLEQSQSHDKESDDEDFDMHSQYSIENYHMNRKEELLFTQTVPTQLSDTDDNEYPIGTKLPEIIALETQYYPLDHEEFDTQPNQLENSNLNQKEIDPESHSHDMLCTQLEQETYGEDYWKGDRSDFSDESRAKLPEYDNDLSDESYIQITTPAYKRMTESLENAHNEATDEIVDMDLDDQDSQSSLREANIHTLQSDYPIFDVESNSQDSDGDREIDKFFSIFAHLNDSASESSSYSEPDTEQEALQDVIEPIQEFSKKDYIDDDHDSEVDELESAILKRHSDMRKSISSVVNDEENDEDEEVLIPEENGTEQSHISVDDDDRQADKSKIDIEEDSNSINSNNRFERNSNYEEVECCNEDKSIYTRGLNVIEEYPCVLLANSTADSVSHHTHSEESENSMTPTLKRIWSKNAKDIAVLDEKIQHGCWTNLRKSWSQYIIPDHESESVIADDYHESSEVEVHQANDFSVDKAGEEIDSHWAPAGDENQYQMIDVEDTQQDEPLHLNDLEGYEDNGNQIEEEDYSELEINLELESEDFGCYSNIDMVSNQRERNMQSSSNEIDEEESADSDKRVSLDELKDEMSPPRTIMESIRRSITPRNVTLSPATGGKETSLSFGCSSSLGGKYITPPSKTSKKRGRFWEEMRQSIGVSNERKKQTRDLNEDNRPIKVVKVEQ